MILSHKTIYTNVLEKLDSQSHSSTGEQQGSFNISAKDRRYLEFQLVQLAKGIWDHLVQLGSILLQSTFPEN